MDVDVVTTVLELVAVLAVAVGLAVMTAAAVGGLLGAGAGVSVAGLVLAAASGVLQVLSRGGER